MSFPTLVITTKHDVLMWIKYFNNKPVDDLVSDVLAKSVFGRMSGYFMPKLNYTLDTNTYVWIKGSLVDNENIKEFTDLLNEF